MYKIQFIPTGHIFVLPKEEAEKLKSQNPDEYLIIEKNGRKCRDKAQNKIKSADDKSILSQVIDRS